MPSEGRPRAHGARRRGTVARAAAVTPGRGASRVPKARPQARQVGRRVGALAGVPCSWPCASVRACVPLHIKPQHAGDKDTITSNQGGSVVYCGRGAVPTGVGSV